MRSLAAHVACESRHGCKMPERVLLAPASEIATAKIAKVPTLRVIFPEYEEPTEEFVMAFQQHVPDAFILTERGIDIDVVQGALRPPRRARGGGSTREVRHRRWRVYQELCDLSIESQLAQSGKAPR